MSLKKILITGANGFVGYHLIEAAMSKGLTVYAGIRAGSDVSHLEAFNIPLVELDYNNESALQKHFEEQHYAYIIHAAGATKAADEAAYHIANVLNTEKLCEAIKAHPPKKFVFISSLAALGPMPYGAEYLIETNSAACPVTIYGKSKKEAEAIVISKQHLPWVIIRPTAIYGPRERDFLVLIKTLKNGLEAYIGRQPQLLSFVYVKDLADVVLQACMSDTEHRAYNISDGEVYSKYEFANTIKKILSKKTIVLHVPATVTKMIAGALEYLSRNKTPLLNRGKIAELTAANWNCSIEAARKDLQYEPQYKLENGLKKTVEWYQNNRWI